MKVENHSPSKTAQKEGTTHLLLFEFLKYLNFVAEKHVRKTDSEVISLKQGGDIYIYIYKYCFTKLLLGAFGVYEAIGRILLMSENS